MIEAGQTIAETRTREFAEEALSHDKKEGETDTEYELRLVELESTLKKLFSNPEPKDILYQGVVDDPRNTDQAWM